MSHITETCALKEKMASSFDSSRLLTTTTESPHEIPRGHGNIRESDSYKEKNREVQKRYRQRCRAKVASLQQALYDTEMKFNAEIQENVQLSNQNKALSQLQDYANDMIESIPRLSAGNESPSVRGSTDKSLSQRFQQAINNMWELCMKPSDDFLRAILSNGDVTKYLEGSVNIFVSRLQSLVHAWTSADDPQEKLAIEKRIKLAMDTRGRVMTILLEKNPRLAFRMYGKQQAAFVRDMNINQHNVRGITITSGHRGQRKEKFAQYPQNQSCCFSFPIFFSYLHFVPAIFNCHGFYYQYCRNPVLY